MTISLENLADGSVSDRNFQKVARLVLDTGGTTAGIRWGSVAAAGGIANGSGFTATRNAVGDYTVGITFPRAPVVLVSAGETAAYYMAKLFGGATPTTAGFRVLCFNPSTLAAVDGIFHWVAVG